jgi:hypothetical protein
MWRWLRMEGCIFIRGENRTMEGARGKESKKTRTLKIGGCGTQWSRVGGMCRPSGAEVFRCLFSQGLRLGLTSDAPPALCMGEIGENPHPQIGRVRHPARLRRRPLQGRRERPTCRVYGQPARDYNAAHEFPGTRPQSKPRP